MKKKVIRAIHIPYSHRNPYQRLLCESLDGKTVKTFGEKRSNIRFVDITLFKTYLKYRRPDILHFHWHHPFFLVQGSPMKTIIKSFVFLVSMVLMRVVGVKFAWTVHNLTSHEKEHANIELWFLRIFARVTHLIITHCSWAKEEITGKLGNSVSEKTVVIPHGNFLGAYPDVTDRTQARRHLKVSDAEVVFLFLGEIRYYKGVFELIAGFKTLNASNARLVIAGKPLDDAIAAEVAEKAKGSDNIQISLGFVADEDLHLYMNAADVMVFPYRDIFTSGSVILGMSFGKPIIAPMNGCINETLDPNGAFTYAASDPGALPEAMKAAMDARARLASMGEYNRNSVGKLAWSRIGKHTTKHYLRITGAHTV